MILRPKSAQRAQGLMLTAAAAAPAVALPGWLRRAVSDAQGFGSQGLEDVAIAAGAAICALDAVVRRQERWSGAWRQRLALAATTVTAKHAGRVEDEAALRDAVLLTKGSDDVGPAGRMLLAWRRLATLPPEDLLRGKNLGAVPEEFGHASDGEAINELLGELHRLSEGGTVGLLTGAFIAAERYRVGRAVGAWLADALLAQRLGWPHAVPLLGVEAALGTSARPRRSGIAIPAGSDDERARAKSLLAAQARAALRAVDLSAELGRRSDRLLAVVPKLRAKAAEKVVDRLLSEDAVVASAKIAGMSDRGLRRLFDRLVELGVVRELSGRPTFRIYGL